MNQPPLSPTNDFVFKKLFAEHTEILTDLLKAILDLPAEEYQGLIVVDPYLRREALEDKQSILDIKIKTKSRKTIDVEVQILFEMSDKICYPNKYVIRADSGTQANMAC